MKPGDELPYLICIECAQEIRRAYSFKKQCVRNDAVLKNLLIGAADSKIDIAFHDSETHCDDSDANIKDIKTENNFNPNQLIKQSKKVKQRKKPTEGMYNNYF